MGKNTDSPRTKLLGYVQSFSLFTSGDNLPSSWAFKAWLEACETIHTKRED
jgi:hypothetical protein